MDIPRCLRVTMLAGRGRPWVVGRDAQRRVASAVIGRRRREHAVRCPRRLAKTLGEPADRISARRAEGR